MYEELARYYDKIYSGKDYEAESERLRDIILGELGPGRWRLLDVACGTGKHLSCLSAWFQAEGLDTSAEMLRIARASFPELRLHQGDMVDFKLGQQFDAVTCLFSSIGYLVTLERVRQALRCMARHLRSGGLLIVEPWFTPESWHPGSVHGLFIDEPELKIARINTSFAEGRLSYFDLHYLIGTPSGTQHLVEHHALGLFTTEEMRGAFEGLGLEASFDPEGLTGRGLFVARKTG